MAAAVGAPPPPTQDPTTSVLATMSHADLFGILAQMKDLIEKNFGQARQTLVDNPQLTKALFQAQIILGMVKPLPGNAGPPGPSPPVFQTGVPPGQPAQLPPPMAPQAPHMPQHVHLPNGQAPQPQMPMGQAPPGLPPGQAPQYGTFAPMQVRESKLHKGV